MEVSWNMMSYSMYQVIVSCIYLLYSLSSVLNEMKHLCDILNFSYFYSLGKQDLIRFKFSKYVSFSQLADK